MVRLTLFTGRPVWVNPDSVDMVTDVVKNDTRTGNARIVLSSTEVIEVKCYAEVVVEILKAG